MRFSTSSAASKKTARAGVNDLGTVRPEDVLADKALQERQQRELMQYQQQINFSSPIHANSYRPKRPDYNS